MGHRERVMAALSGKEVDRPPVSMWRHFFDVEVTGEGMAQAMLAFQRRFDWDFMKVNPRASYHAEEWGLKLRRGGNGAPQVVETPIAEPEDWARLDVLDPTTGVLGEHLRAVETIADGLSGEVPFLMTLFTPLSIAARLAPSEDLFLRHLREHETEVKYALDVVTETFAKFAAGCIERGASGLFYATTSWATTDRMSVEEYLRVARPYDLKLLGSLPECEFNLLHVCRDNNMLASLADYPVHAFNWDARGVGNPSLEEGKALVGSRAVIGGLGHGSEVVAADPREVASQVRGMLKSMGSKGWMLGTGCTVSPFPPETPEANVDAVRRTVEADGGRWMRPQ